MNRCWVLAALALATGTAFLTGQPSAKNDEGILPADINGRPLNLDFESGTLKDWTAEGEAFAGQPIKGDTVFPRRNDMRSQHQGDYWIGSYERHGDKPAGTLTSVAFRVTHPWCSFLIGGGPHPETCVELVRKDTSEVFSRTSGLEEENLRRVAVDLQKHMGKEIFIRVVDRHTGHWGHVNFDDFRFHAAKPKVPDRPVVQAPPALDQLKFAGLAPEKAAEAMTVPEGFTVQLFAGEPDVHQPIAMCLDHRGRVWVAEAFVYPRRLPPMGPVLPPELKSKGDRILIFEDTDGDGHFDKRTVFMEGLNLVSGLEVGFGGVWVGAAPYLMFIPDKNGDDKPDGPPEVLLDGWAWQDTHETLNTFTWGPDGWLYGCHGVFTHSRVGKPGTPDEKRTPINAGIWRYHPTKHTFEVFAHGTSNPWGIDFNDYGQLFCEACVIPHAFHIIQGARYNRQAGAHFNPYTYADIPTIADHFHYIGATPHSGNERSDAAGGGHAHCGLMIYLGGAWPQDYRNQMFMGNIHGRRLNMDRLTAKGSGYVASHGPDFLLANDAWARFINFRYGPDGNVYLIDWYDKQACHRVEPEIWDRTNGRIYKVSYRGKKWDAGIDLSKLSTTDLFNLQFHENDWYARHARRQLQERSDTNPTKLAPGTLEVTHEDSMKLAEGHAKENLRLRGIWTLHATGGLTEDRALQLLSNSSPYVRAWSIQLSLENGRASSSLLKKVAEMAKSDPSPVVRLYLASALQRIPFEDRWSVLNGLIKHSEDATDHNLPLMYWYAAEPLAEVDQNRAVHLASHAAVPHFLQFMARRVASIDTDVARTELVERLGVIDNDETKRLQYLRGMNEGFRGRRQVPMPNNWPTVFTKLKDHPNKEIRNEAIAVAVTFGDPGAFGVMRQVVVDATAELPLRQNALASLINAKDKELAPLLHKLTADAALRGPAIRGLAGYDDVQTPAVVINAYATCNAAEKRDALNTLASRPSYAKAMLDAIATKKFPSGDVTADVVRQLRNLQNKEIDTQIAAVWGVVRDTPADRARTMAAMKRMLTANRPQKPDLALGRAIYAKTCQQCHTLFGIGSKTGPDITGSNRANLDYLLENIIDPSAVIPKDYSATLIELKSGRVLTCIVKEETKTALTVVTANETLIIPQTDVDQRKATNLSLMPDDQLKPMSDFEIRSLFAYLQSPSQSPMLATPENAKDFFNGKDLTGWDGNPALWKVENGEIVGTSPGIKRNEFLRSHVTAENFRLTLKVKLTPNKENSGVQFRSEALPDGEMRGYQADVGQGWWGKLYEEHGREILSDKSGEPFVKVNDWNDYEIVANGSRICTFINGKPCVDLDDPKGAKRGIFALQIHAGGAMEVRFKEVKLDVLK